MSVIASGMFDMYSLLTALKLNKSGKKHYTDMKKVYLLKYLLIDA